MFDFQQMQYSMSLPVNMKTAVAKKTLKSQCFSIADEIDVSFNVMKNTKTKKRFDEQTGKRVSDFVWIDEDVEMTITRNGKSITFDSEETKTLLDIMKNTKFIYKQLD